MLADDYLDFVILEDKEKCLKLFFYFQLHLIIINSLDLVLEYYLPPLSLAIFFFINTLISLKPPGNENPASSLNKVT